MMMVTKNITLLDELVTGYYCNEIICTLCHNVSISFNNFTLFYISLENVNNITITDLIHNNNLEENLFDNNKYQCCICNKKTNAIKKYFLFSCPIVFIVQLERFDKNNNKINTNVTITEKIILNDFFYNNKIYVLYSIIIHEGTTNNGHYYTFSKHNNKWYKYDDDHVDNFGDFNNIKNKICNNGYILFYELENFDY